jgi:hypothetical protein
MLESISLILGTLVFVMLTPYFFNYFGKYFLPTIKGFSYFQGYPKKLDLFLSYAYILFPIILFILLSRISLAKKLPNLGLNNITLKMENIANKFIIKIKNFDSKINTWYWKLILFPMICLFKLSPLPFLDRYHFGEYVIATQLWLKGFVPYIDFVPGHGLINIIGGLLHLNDNFLINIIYGQVIISIIFSLIHLIFTSLITNSVLSAILICLALPNSRPSYLLLFVLGLLLIKFEQNKRFIYLSITFLLTTLLMSLEVSIGAGAVISLAGTLLIFTTLELLKLKEYIKINSDIFWKLILFLNFCLIIYFHQFFTSIILTVLNLSKYNLEAFGIPFIHSLKDSIGIFVMKFLFLPIMSYILIKIIFYRERSIILIFGIIYSLSIMAYSMGRIDPFSLSRAGFSSQILLSFLFLHFYFRKPNIFLPILTTILLIVFSSIEFIKPIKHIRYLTNLHFILQDENLIYPEAVSIKKICNQNNLQNFEFLDLTNNNLSYYFCNTAPPLMASAFYNITDEKFFNRKNNLDVSKLKFVLKETSKISFLHDQVKPQDRIPIIMEKIMADSSFKDYCEDDICYKIKK